MELELRRILLIFLFLPFLIIEWVVYPIQLLFNKWYDVADWFTEQLHNAFPHIYG